MIRGKAATIKMKKYLLKINHSNILHLTYLNIIKAFCLNIDNDLICDEKHNKVNYGLQCYHIKFEVFC